jgi:hypothetical protein
MSLVGKFVFISSGHYYKYGKIAEATDQHNEFFLVKVFSPGHKSDTMSLYNITQMVQVEGQEMSDDDDGSDFGVYWVFFDTEEELMKYVKKIEAPSKKKKTEGGDEKIVNLFNRQKDIS